MTEPNDQPRPDISDLPAAADYSLDLPENLEAARKLRSENKSLRERLHETETDRERLITQLGAAQHREIERVAGEVLLDPADIWRAAPDDQAFYDAEFGEVTRDRVIETAKALAADKPHLARPPQGPPPTDRPLEGLRGGASPVEKPTPVSWADALRGTARG